MRLRSTLFDKTFRTSTLSRKSYGFRQFVSLSVCLQFFSEKLDFSNFLPAWCKGRVNNHELKTNKNLRKILIFGQPKTVKSVYIIFWQKLSLDFPENKNEILLFVLYLNPISGEISVLELLPKILSTNQIAGFFRFVGDCVDFLCYFFASSWVSMKTSNWSCLLALSPPCYFDLIFANWVEVNLPLPLPTLCLMGENTVFFVFSLY